MIIFRVSGVQIWKRTHARRHTKKPKQTQCGGLLDQTWMKRWPQGETFRWKEYYKKRESGKKKLNNSFESPCMQKRWSHVEQKMNDCHECTTSERQREGEKRSGWEGQIEIFEGGNWWEKWIRESRYWKRDRIVRSIKKITIIFLGNGYFKFKLKKKTNTK